MIEYRKIQETDIETIRELYTKFPEFPKPMLHTLPGNGLDGIVGLKDNTIVCACYVYMAVNAPTCWVEWVVADKDYREDDKDNIIIGMLDCVSSIMKDNGYLYLFAMTTNIHLERLYSKAGYDATGTRGVELIKTLTDGK